MQTLQKVEPMAPSSGFDSGQIQLLKTTICKGATDDELKFFIYACQRTGLDPFSRQIYSVPRGGQRVIQTSVDGFRVIADRTGRYCPGKEPTCTYDDKGALISATAYVKKQTRDGTWHEVSARARFDEYDGKNTFWKTKPHIMLEKCAECLALRKAFPAEMSGIYGKEEMEQADIHVKPLYMDTENKEKLSTEQVIELVTILNSASPEYQEYALKKFIQKQWNISILDDAPAEAYDMIKNVFEMKRNDYQKLLAEKCLLEKEKG